MENNVVNNKFQNSSHKTIVYIYVHCIIAAIHDNQLSIAQSMLAKIENRKYQEIYLARAILEYKKGNISGCVQLLNYINASGFNAYYMGFYDIYLGLTSETERQKECFDKAKQSNDRIVIEHLNEIIEKSEEK
jgi:hypothetical protein